MGDGVKKAARLSCRGCRLSKLRCDLETQPQGSSCSRCARIGACCESNGPSMRGRHDRSSRGRAQSETEPAAQRVAGDLPLGSHAHRRPVGGTPSLANSPQPQPQYALTRRVRPDENWHVKRDSLLSMGSNGAKMLFVGSQLATAARYDSYGK